VQPVVVIALAVELRVTRYYIFRATRSGPAKPRLNKPNGMF
jgi:hypothetical protein